MAALPHQPGAGLLMSGATQGMFAQGGSSAAAEIICLETCASTNDEARQRLLASETAREVWVRALTQTAGRGRRGRQWIAENGALMLSGAFCLDLEEPSLLPQLAFVAGLAALDMAKQVCPDGHFRLKWPNDVLVDGAKLCGVLVEAGIRSGRPFAVIGVGANVVEAPALDGRRTIALAELMPDGPPPNAADCAECFIAAFQKWRMVWDNGGGFAHVLSAWKSASIGFGHQIRIEGAGTITEGRMVDLDETGAVLVDLADGTRRRIDTGDVTLVAPVGNDQKQETL